MNQKIHSQTTESGFSRRKKRRRREILFILLILVIAIAILTSFDVTYYEMMNVTVPTSQDSQENLTTRGESCKDYEYVYAYQWNGWEVDERAGMMTPMMEIYNYVDKPGVFHVRFAFIKNETYPWEVYNTTPEKAVPALWSKDIVVTIPSQESVLVIAATAMPEINVAYWTYAEITPPIYHDCTITEKTTVIQNFPRKERTVTKLVEKTAPLGTYLYQYARRAWITCLILPASRS